MLRAFPLVAAVLLASPTAAALLEVNYPAVITITGVMGGGPYQVTTPPGAVCSTDVDSWSATSHQVTVTCTLPDPLYCGDAAAVSVVALSPNGRASGDAMCGSQAWAWCSTWDDPFFPWDYQRCSAHNPGYIDILEGDFDPIGSYSQTLRCVAGDGATTPGVRPVGAYEVECVFPL